MIKAGNVYKDKILTIKINKVYERNNKKLIDFDCIWKYSGLAQYVGASYGMVEDILNSIKLPLVNGIVNENWD